MRLDLELEANPLRDQLDQLFQQQGMLGRRPSRGVTDERRSDLLGRRLVRPAIERGPERQQRIVEQNELAVARQADVGLEAFDRAAQGALERGRRGIRTVMTAESMRV